MKPVERVPLRRIARLAYGDALSSESRREGTIPVVGSGGVSGYHDEANFSGPGIVVGRKGSYGSIHWVPGDGFAIDTAYFINDRLTTVDLRWLYYALDSVNFKGASQDVGVPGLSREVAYTTLVPAPPELDEQRRIADFLDAETSRIDRITQSRDAQASALAEHLLSSIGAMLSGSSVRGPRKRTGWKWLPEIPEHWAIAPVYAHYDTELGKMLNAERASGDRQRPYLRNANVGWFHINIDDVSTMEFGADEVRRYSLREGDLLVCEGGAGVAEAAVWDGRIADCYFQKSLHRVRSSSGLPVEWLMYWLRFAKSCGVFYAEGNVATIPHLTGEQLRRQRLPIPNAPESYIDAMGSLIAATDVLQNKIAVAKQLLLERKQALITAAVTGQFDVTTARRNATEAS
ncbi:restriction endonuclease subunit S [Nocardia puris]|uniref:restriction endonuclease subunit S n=1 Tax=Nocardia puris TaxID=208602 RepID=UPI0018DE9E87|nr:restriction endonuclease subunit S [Nocardia puris]